MMTATTYYDDNNYPRAVGQKLLLVLMYVLAKKIAGESESSLRALVYVCAEVAEQWGSTDPSKTQHTCAEVEDMQCRHG